MPARGSGPWRTCDEPDERQTRHIAHDEKLELAVVGHGVGDRVEAAAVERPLHAQMSDVPPEYSMPQPRTVSGWAMPLKRFATAEKM